MTKTYEADGKVYKINKWEVNVSTCKQCALNSTNQCIEAPCENIYYTQHNPTKEETVAAFKEDFAELLAKYDAEMRLEETYIGFSTHEDVVFSIKTGEFEHTDVYLGTWASKDSV